MEKIMTYETLRKFAYVNDGICDTTAIKGIVLNFFGLGGAEMYFEDTNDGRYYAKHNILYVVPYNNPWAWMNKQAVSYTDEILDILFEKYALGANTPIVATGGSMGGQSALVYTAHASRTPIACVTNCPVCDVVYHFTERVDLPRTMYSCLFNYDTTLDEALRSISPYHIGKDMPKVNYHFFHCDLDTAVNIDSHTERLVALFKEEGFSYTYRICHGRNHTDLTDDLNETYMRLPIDEIESYLSK